MILESEDDKIRLPIVQLRDIQLEEYTCFNCSESLSCQYAWDDYNTHGDCLAEK